MTRFAALLLLLLSPLAFSQTQPSTAEIITELPQSGMRSLLQDLGIAFTEKALDDSYVFEFQLNHHDVSLRNYVKDIRLSATMAKTVDLSTLNTLNSKLRFGRWFLNDSGKAVLEDDLNVAAGVPKRSIEAFIEQFRMTLDKYAEVLEERSTPTTVPAIPAVNTAMPNRSTIAPTIRSYLRSKDATTRVKLSVGDFAFWIDKKQWKQQKGETPGILQFSNATNDIRSSYYRGLNDSNGQHEGGSPGECEEDRSERPYSV